MEAYRAAPPSPTSLGVPMLDDMFKAWNTAFAGDPCQHALLAQMPSRRLYLVEFSRWIGPTDLPVHA